MTITDAREKVARGAALLDRERPGWAQKINLGRLDMSACCFCVLGQLEGSFMDAAISRWGIEVRPACLAAAEYGFHIGVVNDMGHGEAMLVYRPLQDAWVEAIAARVVPVEQPALVNV